MGKVIKIGQVRSYRNDASSIDRSTHKLLLDTDRETSTAPERLVQRADKIDVPSLTGDDEQDSDLVTTQLAQLNDLIRTLPSLLIFEFSG